MNPASWMLDVIGAGVQGSLRRANAAAGVGAGKDGAGGAGAGAGAAAGGAPGDGVAVRQHHHRAHFDFAEVYEASPLFAAANAAIQVLAQPPQHDAIRVDLAEYEIPLTTQMLSVAGRGFRSYWRDSQMNFGRIMMLLMISLIFGIVYVQLNAHTYAGLTSKMSAVFSITGFFAMLSAQTTLPNIFGERAVYYRERASNSYPSWVYSTTIGLCEIPFVFFSSLLGVIIFYFMVGYANDASLFFQFWCAISVIVLIQSSFGQFAAALLPNFVVAIQLAGAINTLFFLFGGVSHWTGCDAETGSYDRAGKPTHSAQSHSSLACLFALFRLFRHLFSCSFALLIFPSAGNGSFS